MKRQYSKRFRASLGLFLLLGQPLTAAMAHDASSTVMPSTHVATSATVPTLTGLHVHHQMVDGSTLTSTASHVHHHGSAGTTTINPTHTMTPNMGVYVHPASSIPIAPTMFKTAPMHFIVNSNPNPAPSLNLHAAALNSSATLTTSNHANSHLQLTSTGTGLSPTGIHNGGNGNHAGSHLQSTSTATTASSTASGSSNSSSSTTTTAVSTSTTPTTSSGIVGSFSDASSASLNLASHHDSVVASNTAPISIMVGGTLNSNGTVSGGTMIIINSGQHITPAQAVALDQIMSNGSQNLIINGQGSATGGLVTLMQGSIAGVSNLVVPTNVTVDTIGYSASNPLAVTGAIHVNGTLLNLEQSGSTASMLSANNVVVGHTGTISDILPSSLSYLNAMSASGLTVNAINNVLNQGAITSGRVLNISAGGTITNQSTGSTVATITAPTVNLTSQSGQFVNSGNITATVSHLTINSPSTINFQNTGGNLTSSAGNINFRESSYAGVGGLTLTGGNISAAQNVNIYSGTGAVQADVNGLAGLVNITADSAHVTASTADLNLGTMNLAGDPSFYNTTGNVTINSNLTYAGQALAVIAHGDIDFGSAVTTINTSAATGGNITLVAGANFTSSGAAQGTNDTTDILTIIGGVPGGGAIDGSSITNIDSSGISGTGGNVNIIAYGGINTGAGTINLGNAAITTTGTAGSGNVTIIDGTQATGSNITVGDIKTAGAVAGTGNIIIGSATPTLAGPVTVAAGGNVAGTPWTMSTGLAGNVHTGAITANGANIILEAGNATSSGNIVVAGSITDTRTTAGSGGTVTINSGSSTALSVGAATANSVSGNINLANTGGGAGGQLTINQVGTGGVTLTSPANINVATTAGNGGAVTVNAGTGVFATNGAGTISANAGTSGNGGQISITAGNFGVGGGPLVLNTSGASAGVGNGGAVTLAATGAGSTLALGGAPGNIDITANSGSTGGNAGVVSVSTGGNLAVNTTTGLQAIIQGGGAGNGSTIALTAGTNGAGNLAVTGSLNANGGTPGGSAGSVTLTSNSATAFNVGGGGTNGISGTTTANAGPQAGDAAGTVTIVNNGTGGVVLSAPASVSVNASTAGGAGGNVTLNATQGTLTLGAGTLNANASGPGSFSGGKITLNGNAIALPAAGTFTTSANGVGGGNGGVINVTAATGTIDVGTTNGNLIVSATGGSAGSASGNGGTVNIAATSGNVTVTNPAAFEVGPLGLNGNGANITVSAGSTTTAGNLLVQGSLNANGVGTGSAGSVILSSNSTTAFTIGSAPGLNGVSGVVSVATGASATGNTAGNVSITDFGTGGITLANDPDVTANAPTAGGNGGNITLAAPNGPLTLPNGTLAVNGSGANGNGGTITVTSKTLSATQVNFDANASGTGNGGIISVITTDPTAKRVDAADLTFFATGGSLGSPSGNGGSVTFTNAGNVTVDPSAITVNPLGTSGAGGTINLSSTAGNLLVTNSIQANGVGGGAGGTISLSSNSATPFLVTNTAGTNGVDGTVSATGSSGGNISLNNGGSGGVTLTSTGVLNNAATNGNGGNLSITSSGGPVTIPSGTFNVSAVGVTNGNGGNVTIKGTTIVVPGTGPLNVVSEGLGAGNAGAVDVEATGTGSVVTVGTGAGNIDISGQGGSTSAGQAAPVTIKSGGNLTVDPTGLALAAGPNANGTTVVLAAGTAGTGNLLVTGSIDVSGDGTGSGGSVTLSSASATPFTVNLGPTSNGIDGTITANGGATSGNGGSITINATGAAGGANGGIALGSTSSVSFNPIASGAGGNGGNLTLNATNPAGSDGAISTPGGTLNASAVGTGAQSGGTITLSSSTLNVTPGTGPLILTANGATGTSSGPGGKGGSINVTTTGATGNITVGNSSGQIEASATGGGTGTTSGNGGSVALSSGGVLTVDSGFVNVGVLGTNGTGGSISLTASTKATNADLTVSGNLNADGKGTGNGGSISLSYSSAGALSVGNTGSANNVAGNINADALGSGNGGTVTIVNRAVGSSLDINLAANSMISANAATATYPSGTTPLGNLILNSTTGGVDVEGAGTLTGFIDSQGSFVTINPTATGAVTTVGAISATSGAANINSNNGIVDVLLNHVASATGNIGISTQTFYIDGTVTSSGASANINVTSPNNLYVGGNGLIQLTGGGAGHINLVAAPGNTLTLDKAPVYSAGAAGNVLFSAIGTGGQIILDAGTNQNLRDGSTATIQSPKLTFQDGAAFTARGASIFNVTSGPAGSNQPLVITTAANGSGQIQTTGGSINIFNSDSGQPITFASSTAGVTTALNLDGGAVTVTQNNSSTTVNAGVNVLSDNNITMNANEGSVNNNGLISTSKASGIVDIVSNADLTVGGTGTISVTGSGAGQINIYASNGVMTGHFLDFTGSQTFNAGIGGAVTWSSPYCPPAGVMGSVNISAGQTETVSSGVPLTIITPILTFGAASGITDTATTGTGINVVSGGNCWLTVTTPTSSTAAMTTSGANFNFSTGPVGGPAAFGEQVIFNQSGAGTSQLTLNGGTVTTTSSGANTTVTAGTTILANNTITINVNNGVLQADGTVHSTTAAGAAGAINVLSTGTLGLNSIGNITVDPTAVNGGAGGTIKVSSVGALTVQAGNLDASAVVAGTGMGGNGGTITVSSSTMTIAGAAPLSLTANAAGKGDGGSISVTTTSAAGNIIVSPNTGGVSFQAQGGATLGNGGSVTVNAGNNLTLASATNTINVTPLSSTGKGGSVTLIGSSASASGTLTLGQSVDTNAMTSGTGSGGSITVTNNSVALLSIPSGTLSANSGSAGGTGGTVTVTNNLNGGIDLQGNITATGTLNTASTPGNSGQITVSSTNGNVQFDGGTLNASGATGAANSSGGAVTVSALTISEPGTTEIIQANGSGAGSGGAVSLTTTGSGGNINLGSGFQLNASGGSSGSATGNGGSVSVSAGNNLDLATGSINVAANGMNGNGGTVHLTGSTAASGTMTLGETINASGVGIGNGGTITATNDSTSPLVVPPTEFVANSGTTGVGGTIQVTNLGNVGANGGILIQGDLQAEGSNNTATNFGQITVNAGGTTPGAVVLDGGTLNASAQGTATSNGGSVSVTGAVVNLASNVLMAANATGSGNGGTVSVTTVGATGDIAVGTSGTGLNISATGGSAGSTQGDGGNVILSAGRNLQLPNGAAISVNPLGTNGSGGKISLTAGTKAGSGFVQINEGLTADGVGTGSGGTVVVSYNDPAGGTITVGAATGNNFVDGSIHADAGAIGNGGNVTVTNTGVNALTVALTGADITAAAGTTSGTLGNLNFPTPVLAPQAVSVTGNGNLTGLVNSNGTSVLINPTPATATILTVGVISATSGDASALTNCSNGSQTIIPVGSSITTTGANSDVQLMGMTVLNNGMVSSSRDVYIQTPAYTQSSGTMTVTRDLNFSTCMTGTPLVVTASTALSAGRNITFDVKDILGGGVTTPGQITVTAPSILAGNNADQIQINPGSASASIVATGAIQGIVTNPNATLTPSDNNTISSNSATVPLEVGGLNASTSILSSLNITNSATGGTVSVLSNISGSTIFLTADNISNVATVSAVGNFGPNISNLNLSSSASGNMLTVSNTGALDSTTGNVNFNGTNSTFTGSLNISGSGTIASTSFVNLNIGSGTATVSQTSIAGMLEDPSGIASGSVFIKVLGDASGSPLTIGTRGFNATGNSSATFSAVNSGSDGGLAVLSSVSASGDVTLSADNVSNQNSAVSFGGNIIVTSSAGGRTLNLDNSGNLLAATGNIELNGTTMGTAGGVTVTDLGQILAQGTGGVVDVNLGTGTAQITQLTIQGILQDPNASGTAGSSGSVTIMDASATPLQLGTFGSTSTVNITNSGDNRGNGDVQVVGNVFAQSGITVAASGTNASITEGSSNPVLTSVNFVNLSANGGPLSVGGVSPGGVGSCATPILIATPLITAYAPNGAVRVTDSVVGTIDGMNAANGTDSTTAFHIEDTANGGTTLSFANGSTVVAFNTVLQATSGAIDLTNASIASGGGVGTGNIEIISNGNITGTPTQNLAPNFIVLQSVTGDIGSSANPFNVTSSMFSATAGGSVYINALAPGIVTIVNPNAIAIDCSVPIIGTANTATNFYVQAPSATNLETGAGVAVTATNDLGLKTTGSIGGIGTNQFVTSAANITANAGNGAVNILNNATGNVSFISNNIFGGTISNFAAGIYNYQQTGAGTLTNNDHLQGGTGVSLTLPNTLTNAGTIVAIMGDVSIMRGNPGAGALTVNTDTNSNIQAKVGNVNVNAEGATGQVNITGTGNIEVDTTMDHVNLYIGTSSANVVANSILGCIQDPDAFASTPIASGNVSISVTTNFANSAANPLMVGHFNATQTGAKFSATNSESGGAITTCGPIISASTLSLKADNVTNDLNGTGFALTSSSGDVSIQSSAFERTLTLNNDNLITATNGNVDLNGSGAAVGSVTVTGTGSLLANGNDFINVSLGALGTANIQQSTLQGILTDPGASPTAGSSGPVIISDASSTPLQLGTFGSDFTINVTNAGIGGVGDVNIVGGSYGNNSITISATGNHANINDGNGSVLTTNGAGSVILTANGGLNDGISGFPGGVGSCDFPVFTNTPNLMLNAPNGSVRVTDSAAATFIGANSANATSSLTSFHVEDDSASPNALSFMAGSSITAFNTVLNTTAGGINSNNANIQSGGGNVEIVSYGTIFGTPTLLNPGALILQVTNGDIGTNATPFVVTTPSFSAGAPNGSVYINDTSADVNGNVTIINPDTTNIACGITITGANTALNDYFVEATNANATALLTGTGSTVTTTGSTGHVAALAPNGSVGTAGTPFATATDNLTAVAGNGLVNVSNNNGTNPVNLVGNTIFGTNAHNSATGTYTFTQAGTGPISNEDQVTGGTGVVLNTPGTINNMSGATITATTGDVTLASTDPLHSPLTVNTSTASLITATAGNVNFNTEAAPGAVVITGVGDITVPTSMDHVNLYIGTSTANVVANAIQGCIQDPDYLTVPSGSVSISVAQNLNAATPLMVGHFSATEAGATFSASNSNATGGVTTCGPITADGNVTLSAQTVTNANVVTSDNGNVTVSGNAPFAAVTLANSGTLISNSGSVELNMAGSEGPVIVTGTGTISAATVVDVNIGGGSANITQGTISGLIKDPIAFAPLSQSDTVNITVSSATPITLGAFNSVTTLTATNNGDAVTGIGDVAISANSFAQAGVNIQALGTNGNITDLGGFTLGSPTSVILTSNAGPTSGALGTSGGVGSCANPILINSPVLTANAPNGSVRVTDASAVAITGINTANGSNANTSYHVEDDDPAANSISFAAGSSISAFTTILNTPNGGIDLTNANVSATGGAGNGNIEVVTKFGIAGVPTTNFAPNTLILASTNGSIGSATTPLVIGASNISASAPTGSVYINDTNTGTVSVIDPNTAGLHCGLTVTGANTAATQYFLEGSGSFVTGTGATVTAPSVVLDTSFNIGTPGGAGFSTSTQELTAQSGGDVNIANSSATTTTLSGQTVGAVALNNSTPNGSFSVTQTGGGDLSLANNNIIDGHNGVSLTTSVLNLGTDSTVFSLSGNVNIAGGAGSPLTINMKTDSDIDAIGTVNLQTPASPGQITVTGNTALIIGNAGINFNGGTGGSPVNVNVGEVGGPISVTGSTVSITTQIGNVNVVSNIDTSSGKGPGGNVTLVAMGGAVTAQNITTNGTNTGTAGNITINSNTPTTFGDLSANGSAGAGAGVISITAPTVHGGYIDDTTSGSTLPGGNVTISTTALTLNGADGAGASINVSNTSNTGNGGTVNLNTTSPSVFSVGPGGAATGNGTNGSILANGVNGGFVTMTNAGNLTVNAGGLIEANGTTGTGGDVLIQNSTTPGTNPLVVINNGTISAISNSATTGLNGLNGGPGQTITVLGNGTFIAGECTHIGNLDQTNLDFLATPSGTITVSATLTFIPHYCTRSSVIIINLPTKPSIALTQPNNPHHNHVGVPFFALEHAALAKTNGVGTFGNPLLGGISVFGQKQFQFDSKTPTDITQVDNFANVDQMVNPNPIIEEKNKGAVYSLIAGSKTFKDEFADEEKNRLNQENVLIGSNTQRNFFNLDKGNVVFNPSKDIVVQTHEGEVYIAANSSVFVMENGHDVCIYNLHDGKRNAVSIISAKKKLVLEPGRMLVLSRQDTRDFEKITAGFHAIGYRNVKEVDLDPSIRAFYGDFSIPSAMTMVIPLKKMFASSDSADRAAVDRILKTSVMLTNFTPSASPFNGGLPPR